MKQIRIWGSPGGGGFAVAEGESPPFQSNGDQFALRAWAVVCVSELGGVCAGMRAPIGPRDGGVGPCDAGAGPGVSSRVAFAPAATTILPPPWMP